MRAFLDVGWNCIRVFGTVGGCLSYRDRFWSIKSELSSWGEYLTGSGDSQRCWAPGTVSEGVTSVKDSASPVGHVLFSKEEVANSWTLEYCDCGSPRASVAQ